VEVQLPPISQLIGSADLPRTALRAIVPAVRKADRIPVFRELSRQDRIRSALRSLSRKPIIRRSGHERAQFSMSPTTIYDALTTGRMRTQGSQLSNVERRQVAEYITLTRFKV
jgi:hypothetical protein